MHAIFDHMSLRVKATVVVLAIILVGLAFNAVVMFLHTNQLIAQQQLQASYAVARSLAQASELALSNHDSEELNRLARGVLINQDILFAAIYQEDGTLQAYSTRDEALWKAFQDGWVRSPEFLLGDSTVIDQRNKSEALHASPQVVGRVLVALSTKPMLDAQRQAAGYRLATSTVVIACCGTAIYIMFSMWNRRVQRLVAASESIAGGDFSESIDTSRHDELGRLCQTFEEMRKAVQKRDTELREFNETLQHQIAQRTADLQQAVVAAQAASQAKSQFLANMSHEIRTPMTAILGYADLMVDPSQGPSDRLECIQTIRRNSAHLLSVINDILDISKIEAGKLAVERIQCSPIEIIADVASLMRGRALEKDLNFDVEYVGQIPSSICTDPTRLRQILMNLCGNGIKFTKTGGVKIVVRLITLANPDHPTLRLEIIDTGIGLDKDQKHNLFMPFTQADATTTRTFGGTGLGLTISKRLARMLGGDIHVRSEPGKGSTFMVEIETGPLDGVPLLENVREALGTQRTVSEPEISPLNPPSLAGITILLAEDGPDNQRLIAFHLRKAGAKVTIAENGRIACDLALQAIDEGKPFDVILMDMQMPEMDGYTASSRLRSKDYNGPIIALTAHAMEGDREKCIRSGCNDYASKPIDRLSLLSVIHRWAVSKQATSAGN